MITPNDILNVTDKVKRSNKLKAECILITLKIKYPGKNIDTKKPVIVFKYSNNPIAGIKVNKGKINDSINHRGLTLIIYDVKLLNSDTFTFNISTRDNNMSFKRANTISLVLYPLAFNVSTMYSTVASRSLSSILKISLSTFLF